LSCFAEAETLGASLRVLLFQVKRSRLALVTLTAVNVFLAETSGVISVANFIRGPSKVTLAEAAIWEVPIAGLTPVAGSHPDIRFATRVDGNDIPRTR